MKTRICFVLMCTMMLTGQMKADFQEFVVCDDEGKQAFPDIDGDFVVWQEGASNEDIAWKDLSGVHGLGILTYSGEQEVPAVSGGVVIWYDKAGTDRDVAGYDIIASSALTFPVDDGVHQRNPKISGLHIICEHYTGSFYNAAVLNGTQYDLIDASSQHQLDLAIDGSRVVWRQLSGSFQQIFLRDIEAAGLAVQLNETTTNQYRPDISGDLIVWEEVDALGDVTVVLYDDSLDAVVWTHPIAAIGANPAVCDGIVVWNDLHTGRDDHDIVGYDYNGQTYLDIATGAGDDRMPAISGRTVVWERNGVDIYGAEIPELAQLTLIEPNGGQMYLAESDMEIRWQCEGGQIDQVKLDYSMDDGQIWQVVEPNTLNDGQYFWDPIADVDSQRCRIKVSAVGDSPANDMSDTVFTIYPCSESLTADLTGDCFVGIDDFSEMAAQWLACGNPYDINCFSAVIQ